MDLCDIQQIKALLSRHGFHFSKSMGQNFLVEDWVPRDIAEASGASPSCAVLEVGPGIGRDNGRQGKCGDRSSRHPED